MAAKIRIHADALRNLARDYDGYGEAVWQAGQTARRQLERELEGLLHKYAAYPSVTSKIHEMQSRLRTTEQRIRELRERSEELGRRLRKAADEYAKLEDKEKNLIRQLQASFAKMDLPTFGGAIKAGLEGVRSAVAEAGEQLWNKAQATVRAAGSVIQGLDKKIDSAISSIQGKAAQAARHVSVAVDNFRGHVRQAAVKIGEKVEAKLKDTWEGVKGFVKKSRDTVTAWYGKLQETFREAFTRITEKTNKLIDDIQANKTKWRDGLKKALIIGLDVVQFGLDIAGLIPVYGEIADGVNALIYALRGDYVSAGLSLAAMVPFAGWAATGAKWTGKAMKLLDRVGGVSGLVEKTRHAAKVASRYGREVMGFLEKKGQEVYSLIQSSQVVRKATALAEGLLKKYDELKTGAVNLVRAAYEQVLGGVQVSIGRQPALAGVGSGYMKHEGPEYGNLKPTPRQIGFREAMEEAGNQKAADIAKVGEGAGNAIKSGSFDSLPKNAQTMYKKYEENGWKGSVSGQTPGTAAGSKYANRDGKLPTTDSSGNPITYKEFDVNPESVIKVL